MEQMDAPRGRHRQVAPGLPGAADSGGGVVPRLPQMGVRGMLLLHRTDEGEAPDALAVRHHSRGLQTQGDRGQEPQGRRPDLHRVLRCGPRLPRPDPGPGGGVRPLRGAPLARVRRAPRGQRQRGRHRVTPGRGRAGAGDPGRQMHGRQRAGTRDGVRGPPGRDGEQPEQHLRSGARRRTHDQPHRRLPRTERDAAAPPRDQHRLRAGRGDP